MSDSLIPAQEPRKGLTDLWNSTLCRGATWSELDNPLVSCTSKPPERVISLPEAKAIHKQQLARGIKDYRVNAHVHCYVDDQKFDGPREGIWKNPEPFFKLAAHFDGILGVDFSTYADFPEPVKRMQFHKMRVIEHAAIQLGIPVIPNVRWGTPETWDYCFDALPQNAMLSLGVVGSGIKRLENRPIFEVGLPELVRRLQPTALVVVGSAKYKIFDELRSQGITIYSFDGQTCARFKALAVRHV